MAFAEVDGPARLPAVGKGHEVLTLDFKVKPATTSFEMAKDIAALANASGGTLLVGAAEDQARKVLSAYVPMAEVDAASAEQDYSQAARDLCLPKPLLTCYRIPQGAGFVLAINVWPNVAQPVSVKVTSDKACGFGGAAYVFPLRLTTHTVELDPDQGAMLTLPSIRKTVVLLSRIASEEVVRVVYTREHVPPSQFYFRGADVLENRVALAFAVEAKPVVHIPLESVKSVWRDQAGWTLLIAGSFDSRTGIHRWIPARD